MSLQELFAAARASGDFGPLVAAIPYSRFLGLAVESQGADLVMRLPFAPHLVGNSLLPALHGGTIGALLESTAIFRLLHDTEADQVPKTINVTIEYLRSAGARDTFARAEITKHGRRVANVRAVAWQDDPARPVAAAHAHFLL